ncbi:hypothetical protein FHG87_006892 [Trinorchestia longiramus]|nr:hypothetical protein FHG87_006892 [Trinorchestia longiramus]
MKATFVSAIVFFGLLSLGYALKCYECNSHETPGCYDMSAKSSLNLVDCDTKNDTHEYTLCRKLHMFLDESVGEHPSEDRIHRACGYISDDDVYKRGDCYYKSGYNTRTWVCSCNEDECNSATTSYVSAVALALVAISISAQTPSSSLAPPQVTLRAPRKSPSEHHASHPQSTPQVTPRAPRKSPSEHSASHPLNTPQITPTTPT